MEGASETEKKPPEGEVKTKRKMKTASQLEMLEKTFAVSTYPPEAVRAELSVKLGLSDRQLQMWFCHRRLKDKKPPSAKRARKDSSTVSTVVTQSVPTVAPSVPTVAPVGVGLGGDGQMVGEVGNEYGSGSGSGSSPFGQVDYRRAGPRSVTAVGRAGAVTAAGRAGGDVPAMKMYYEPTQSIAEIRAISFVEAQLGHPLREDGPMLGTEFDALPPDAFGAPIAPVRLQKQTERAYEGKLYEQPDNKSIKGSRALHEYQFLPEQPTVKTESYELVTQSHYYGSPSDGLVTRTPFTHGKEQASLGYDFPCQMPCLNLLPQPSRQGNLLPPVSVEYDALSRKNPLTSMNMDAPIISHPINAVENPFLSPERRVYHSDDIPRMERKQKNEEARIAKEVEAHEKRIRKELEKQDVLRRKREEQIRKEMERHDRERRREEERLLREKLREEERYQREQRRELERREKFLQKETIRAEKMRLKEELRREKEAARLKAASDRATARRLAKESMELIEDERLELMEFAASSKGLPSILSLDGETLQNIESFTDMLAAFPPKSVQLIKPFSIKPWVDSEKNVGNLLMVWRFLITFADVLGLWPFTLDEFVQAFHDYDPRLLSEVHVALLRSIIKDIEDVARAPSTGMGGSQNYSGNPGGGHLQIIEGAYAWGFDIRSWQRHLNPLTWPEILRQFALASGFGPQLKKKSVEEPYFLDDNDGNCGGDVIFNLRNGLAAENAVAIMQERGFSNPRRSRHCLTPGTVKFAAFHVLSLEGSKGLTILEVADRIQKSGLRDLTTSKTPEASIAAALSRDVKLFERTAPSTYCVRSPYRKDPANAESILSEARERVLVFKNGFSDGEDAENVERDEDSESDIAEDPDVDYLDPESNSNLEAHQSFGADDDFCVKTPLANGDEAICDVVSDTPFGGLINADVGFSSMHSEAFQELMNPRASIDESVDGDGVCKRTTDHDDGETEIDESYTGEPWVQGLMEGEYSDLSVEERLDALVALIGVAIEGNSIRTVLEERLEAANALKKQMWAEAQLDKRRMKEEYVSKMQYSYVTGNRTEQNLAVADGKQSPLIADDKNNEVLINVPGQQEPCNDAQNENGYLTNNLSMERNTPTHDFSTTTENIAVQQTGYPAEKSRSQVKSYIGHKAEEMYVYRSLPLGQDRRRNRYWQFKTSASQNDPGCGWIFVELSDGSWRLIASEVGFDALLDSLDTRGVRESHLHMMLQKIEKPFKEALRRNSRSTTVSWNQKAVKSETSELSPNYGVDTDSTSSTVCAMNCDRFEPSPAIVIELGRNDVEKSNSVNRYQDFEKWMWQECLNSSVLGATKYGKKRCMQLKGICDYCHDVYLYEENHCPSCKSAFFSEQTMQCEDMVRADPDRILLGSESSLPSRVKLLKAQLVLLEVSILPEALSPEWTEDYRKFWGMKLHASVSAENLLQILSALEGVVKKDFVSSSFATSRELLKSCCLSRQAYKDSFIHGAVPVLPWIPNTTAAVALRLMEIDASIFYTLTHKVDSQRDKEVGEFTKLPSRFPDASNFREDGLLDAMHEGEYALEENWAVPMRGGRGGRGRGRGRARGGGRLQRRVRGSRPESTMRTLAAGPSSRRLGGVLGWKGQARGRGGRRRGRRAMGSRQKTVKQATPENHYQMGNTHPLTGLPVSLVPEEWNLDEGFARVQQGDEAETGSSGRSEYEDDYIGQALEDESDEIAEEVYGVGDSFNGSSGELLLKDEAEEDIDDIFDEEDEEQDGSDGGEGYLDGDSDEDNGDGDGRWW